MKLWVDKHNEPPSGYQWAGSIDMAIEIITEEEAMYNIWHMNPRDAVEEINIAVDMDLDNKLAEWLKDTGRDYVIKMHYRNQQIDEFMNSLSIKKQQGQKKLGECSGCEWTLSIFENC